MDDDIDDYKLDTTWHQDPSHVVHTSFERDRRQRGRKAKIETKWYRKEELGVGSCGVVYLETTEDGGERAVKCIRKSMAARLKIDYRRELAAISTFSKAKYQQHQIFVEFLGWFENPEFIFVAMEYLPLGDLSKHVSEDIKEHDLKDISSQLLEGLRLMHSKGFTHRDLKPQNIFVVQTTPSWWVKIGDFGIAKRVRDGDATELRTATGTQGYEAPEIRGYVEVDEQNPSSIYTNVVDIWSFGCVIYKIVAKQVPFKTGRDIKLFCDERKSFPAEPLQGKLTIDGIDFLKSVLIPKAPARPTADVALRHPWLMSDVDDIESHQGLNIELSNEEHSSPLEANTAAQPHQSEKQGKSRFSTTLDGKDFQAKIKVAVEMEGRHGKSSSSMGDLHPSSHSPSQFASSVPTPESEALLAPIGSGKSSPSGRGSSQSERLLNSTGPDDPEVGAKYFNEKGLLAFNDKNWNAAILHTTRALQLDPGRPIYLCNRAAAYVEAKLYMKALEDLEAAIKGDRFLTSAWYWLGIMRCEQGYSEKSMEAFWECIMCRPYDYNEDTEPFVKHARFELQKITDERDAKATKTLLAPVSLRTKSGPATERTVASPSLIKVRVNVRGNSVALVVAFIITYDALVSLIDTRINQFTHKSVRRGELRLKHLTYNGVLLDISSDEDIRKAFNIWSEKNRFHPGRLGEIYLLCLTEAESESFLAVPPPDRMTLSPSGRERESAEPANRDLKSHRLPASTTQVPPGRAVYRERPTLPAIVSAIPTVYGTKQKPKERSFFGKLKDKLG